MTIRLGSSWGPTRTGENRSRKGAFMRRSLTGPAAPVQRKASMRRASIDGSGRGVKIALPRACPRSAAPTHEDQRASSQISMRERMSMYNGNALKIGLFGANCSSGRAVTRVPERWSGNWPDNLRLARMADDAGLDFLLPIARWKGYGGDTDYQGATLETVNWASGCSHRPGGSRCSAPCMRRCSTRSSPPKNSSPPITSARGVSASTSWSAGTRTSSTVRGAAARARRALRLCAGMGRGDEDGVVGPRAIRLRGEIFQPQGRAAKPKPFGGTRPVMMNAGASDVGRAFALRNCEAFFTNASRTRARRPRTRSAA